MQFKIKIKKIFNVLYFFLIILSLSAFTPGPAPKLAGNLSVVIAASDTPEYFTEWITTPPDYAPIIPQIRKITSYEPVHFGFLITGFTPDKTGELNCIFHFKLFKPDGTIALEQNNCAKVLGKAPVKASFIMADRTLELGFENTDPPGEYKVQVVVEDFVSKKSAEGAYFFELVIEKSQTEKNNERFVDIFLGENESEQKNHVERIYSIAGELANSGKTEKAIQLYKAALKVDPDNLAEQFKLANLLIKDDNNKDAISILQLIYNVTEDAALFTAAVEKLSGLKIEQSVKIENKGLDPNMEIILVPVDVPNPQILMELQGALQEKMGIKCSISEKSISLGEADKKLRDYYIFNVFSKIYMQISSYQRDLIFSKTGLNNEKLGSVEYQEYFLENLFDSMGEEGKPIRVDFANKLKEIGDQGQYDVHNATKKISENFPDEDNDKIKAYIGVTAKDLYADGSNFLFGTAESSYGIISYYRFTADFNVEEQNRPRLVKRLLKQALSTCNFAFYSPRCDSLSCVRSYPHSLEEHDAKSEDLCEKCKENLTERKALAALIAAKQNNDKKIVKKLLAEIDINKIYFKGLTPLAIEIMNNHPKRVKTLMELGAGANIKIEGELTPFTFAVSMGNADVVRVLLEEGLDANTMILEDETVLMYAASRGYADIVKILIKHGANVDAKAAKGGTALLFAAQKITNVEAMKILIDAGADVNVKTKQGYTPLMCAAFYGCLDCVDILLKAGADVKPSGKRDTAFNEIEHKIKKIINPLFARLRISSEEEKNIERNENQGQEEARNLNETALTIAAARGFSEIVQRLLEAGADKEARNDQGGTALMLAVEMGDKDTILKILEGGADVNARKQNDEWTPLMFAAQNNRVDCMKILLKKGADLKAKNKFGWSSLMIAAKHGSIEAVNLLLDSGVEVNGKGESLQFTPLMCAARDNQAECIKALLKRGANIEIKNEHGYTALIFAAEKGRIDAIRTLLASGAQIDSPQNEGWTPLMFATKNRQADCVQFLLDKGADVNAKNDKGMSALMLAAFHDDSDILIKLLNAKADINARQYQGFTPLMIASDKNKLANVKVLISGGADVNLKKQGNFSALMMAAKEGHLEVIEELLKAGADVNAKNDEGTSALIFAAYKGHTKIVGKLVESGADINTRNNDNYSPLMIARAKGYTEIMQFLLKAGAEY